MEGQTGNKKTLSLFPYTDNRYDGFFACLDPSSYNEIVKQIIKCQE